MTLLRSLWGRWVALLSRQEDGASVAALRIALGLCALYTTGTVAVAGMVPVLWMDRANGGYQALTKTWWLVELLGGPTPSVVWGLVGASMLASTLLALGLFSRLAAFVALQTLMALTWLNASAGGSYDDLITNALWLMVLADGDATWSLASRIRTGAWRGDRQVSSWPRYLFVFQLIVMYASTAAQKLSAYWTPGGDFSALYYILQQPTWQRVDMRWLGRFFPLTQVATASTWLWELSAPLLGLAFYFRDTRTAPGRLRALFNRLDFRLWYAAFGVMLHLGIQVSMEVGPFSFITLSYYLALVHPDELASLGRSLRRVFRAGSMRTGS